MTIGDVMLSLLTSVLGSILGALILQRLGPVEATAVVAPARCDLTSCKERPLR